MNEPSQYLQKTFKIKYNFRKKPKCSRVFDNYPVTNQISSLLNGLVLLLLKIST
jgi:hypothetical protein